MTSLRDGKAKIKIVRRIERAEQGNLGDHKQAEGPVWEMRIYYTQDTVCITQGRVK